MSDTPTFRGTPPNQKQMAQALGPDGLKLWEAVVAMVREFEASWRWMHSESTGSWSYRSYLPGERFFVALSLTEGAFEASFNLKAEEWALVHPEGEAEEAAVAALKAQALESGDEPAWLHVSVTGEPDVTVLSKLLVARGKRVQPPRGKKRKGR